jgi:choline dehydrogenase-like flavoprotein
LIVDASVLPTSAAVNPALTVAALALRDCRPYHLPRDLAA